LAAWRHLKSTKTEAFAKPIPMHPALKQALLEWRAQSHRREPEDFVLASRLYLGQRALDLGAVLKRKIRPAFEKLGISGIGWHTFRHRVGTLLAEMGEHQLTIRDYLRHSYLSVTNKYFLAASNRKRKAQDKLLEAILPVQMRVRTIVEAEAQAGCTLAAPRSSNGPAVNLWKIWRGRRESNPRRLLSQNSGLSSPREVIRSKSVDRSTQP
jgi:hypothetical protein